MSNLVYPDLPGLGYSVTKTPNWGTREQRSVSGERLATSDYANPIWKFTLKYEVLRDGASLFAGPGQGSGFTELRTLMDFFNSRAGAFDTFLFDDPTDDFTQDELIGIGDGTCVGFQLRRRLIPVTGFPEAIIAPNIVNAVTLNGVATTAYTVDYTTGIVTFGSPGGAGVMIRASFSYYFRVYFTDSLEFENFLYQLWELKQVKLTSTVLRKNKLIS